MAPNEPIPTPGAEEDRNWLLLQPAFSGTKKKKKKPSPDLPEEDLLMPAGEEEQPETLRSKLARRKVSVMNSLEKE